MNPNYIHTITIYRNQNGAWKKTVLHNCFWKSKIVVLQNETEASQTNTYIVRIPVESVGNSFPVSPGDIVVRGNCRDKITGKSPDTATEVLLRNKPDAFKVTAFSDNTSHPMGKHYRLGG
ncbi:MAG: hypothetical protein IJ468_14910 [Lachnospiraceae bacterium]|nr:hypothetical protein [Lachnospiraceae bacterium]